MRCGAVRLLVLLLSLVEDVVRGERDSRGITCEISTDARSANDLRYESTILNSKGILWPL